MSDSQVTTITTKGTFEEVISKAPPEMQEIAHAARNLLIEVMPDLTEVPWGQQKIAGYGVGLKKMSEQFCYIAPYKKHVNLGFYYGVDLDDPKGLLEGSGKELRHIKLYSLDDVNQAAVKKLVKAASKHLPKLKKT